MERLLTKWKALHLKKNWLYSINLSLRNILYFGHITYYICSLCRNYTIPFHLHECDLPNKTTTGFVITWVTRHAGATCWAGSAYRFGAPASETTPSFCWGSCCLVFSFLCCVICTIIFLFVFFILSHGVVSLFSIYEFDCNANIFCPSFIVIVTNYWNELKFWHNSTGVIHIKSCNSSPSLCLLYKWTIITMTLVHPFVYLIKPYLRMLGFDWLIASVFFTNLLLSNEYRYFSRD